MREKVSICANSQITSNAIKNTVYPAFSKFILWWAMDLVGEPNTKSPIWIHFHSCHPSTFVHVSSSSRHRKLPAGQVCIGEASSKLAKYERDSGKWKMPTRNVATYAAIPIPQTTSADEEFTRLLAWSQNSEPCLNRTPRRNTTGWVCLQDIWTVSVHHK